MARLARVKAPMLATFRRHERTGRPLGSPAFLDGLEILLQRPLRPRRPGRKRKDAEKQVWRPPNIL